MNYPKYDFNKISKLKKPNNINIVLVIIAVSKFIPIYEYNVLAVVACLIIIRQSIEPEKIGVSAMGKGAILLGVLMFGYDLLDYKISWSITVFLPVIIIVASILITALVMLKRKRWELCYSKYMGVMLLMIFLVMLCLIRIIQFDKLFAITLVITIVSSVMLYLKVGRDYLDKLKIFVHA